MADDIIDRLQCTYRKGEWPCEECTFCAARAEIERLRAERDDWQSEYLTAFLQLGFAVDEIANLRAALAIAAGMISTLPQYEHQHPESVMEMLLEEARRG